MPDLRPYIRSYRKQGYTDQQIRDYLLTQGYSQAEVDKAMRPFSPLIIVLIIGIILAIGLGFFLWLTAEPEVEETKVIEQEVTPPRKAPVLPTQKQPVGQQPKESEGEDACPGGCNDFDICTQDVCIAGRCEHNPIVPCCGNLKCEVGENSGSCPSDCKVITISKQEATATLIERATETAKTDVSQAAKICQSLPRTQDTDRCIRDIAKYANDSRICGQIVTSNMRDSCYLDFALEKDDFTVCEKIDDRWLKQSCFSYQQLQQGG